MASLEARLSVGQSGGPGSPTARVELVNRGGESVSVDATAVRSPSLSLRVRDADGETVALPPPPDRRERVDLVEIPPNGVHRVVFGGFLPSWTPRGVYTVQFRTVLPVPEGGETADGEVVESDWVELRIGV